MTRRVSLNQQIQELDRELAARRMDPARFRKMFGLRESEAEYFIERLDAARNTLLWLQRHEDQIRAALGTTGWQLP